MRNLLFYCVAFLLFACFDAQINNAYANSNHDENCIRLCGEGYHYDRPGKQRNGSELVCTKYPFSCGYKCTVGWNFRYLVDGTNYTCQEAIQKPQPEATNCPFCEQLQQLENSH